MKYLLAFYVISVILYIIPAIYLLKEDLKKGISYTILEFVFFYVMLPIVPFVNTYGAIIFIIDLIRNANINKNFNDFLLKIFKIEYK